MAIIVRGGGRDFRPAPPGLQPAVCVDVVELPDEPNKFKPGTMQRKVRLVWQTAELNPDDNLPFIVTRKYTRSLDEKSALRKDLEPWRNRAFSEKELDEFDLEQIIGVCCQLMIQHKVVDGKTYANVTTIVPYPQGGERILPRSYVRVKDRDPQQQQPPSAPMHDEEEPPF